MFKENFGLKKEKSVVLTENFIKKAEEVAREMLAAGLQKMEIPERADFFITTESKNEDYDYFQEIKVGDEVVYLCWMKEKA